MNQRGGSIAFQLGPITTESSKTRRVQIMRAIKRFMWENKVSLLDIIHQISLCDQLDQSIMVFYDTHLILRVPPKGKIEEVWRRLTNPSVNDKLSPA